MIGVDDFHASADAWLADNAAVAPRDYGAILPPELGDAGRAWQRRLFDAGFAGIHWPEEHGGRGLTPEHTAAWIEACALAEVPAFINMVGVVLAGGSILLFGTDDQKREHLRPILTGERVWCQLFSEPGAGSDLASLTTRAERDGDVYVLTGQKVWCSNGRISDYGICLARTDPSAVPHKGISFFLVEMHAPGVEVRPLRQMTGGSEFDEVFLDEVRVPASNLLGPEHGGWGVAMATLTNERGHIGASAISLRRRLDAMAASGQGLDPVARDELSALLARGIALLALSGRQGPVASVAASLMKLGVTELMVDVASARLASTGPAGMLSSDASAAVVAAPAGKIAGGTTEVQRNIIGERILGLPKEPRPAR
ncbi:MAG TPA: acyl-CoA dehydrogenase family protein [Acidimicrobiales bacterium]|jgi:alkylation response protein AidB-like acyl-CoA dehydrogenase|nr:acyl-CoA dehydrogenase family protein [Acidimicrobiales bacterium]